MFKKMARTSHNKFQHPRIGKAMAYRMKDTLNGLNTNAEMSLNLVLVFN